jgi:hypothetical protein
MTSKTTNKFSPEVRARAVRMVLDRRVRYEAIFLFESHADAISLSPNDTAGKRNIISLKDDVKTLWD